MKISIHSRDKRIPMEVVLDGGRVETNLESVLHKWKTDFSSLFNRPTSNREPSIDVNHLMADTEPGNHVLDGYITVFEVRKAIFNAKRNKSPGFDEIPADVFRNDSSVSYLHILFNVCLRSGMMPSG